MAQRKLENTEVHQPAQLTPVVPVTPAHGWWTGSNNVGSELPFAPDSNLRQTILKLPEIGAPEEWTISLYLVTPVPAGANLANFRVTAVIEFGAGGTTQIIEMDWINGAQITLPCNAINVIAEYSTASTADGIRLGVQVARGRRGGNQPPRKTIVDLVQVGPGATVTFPIPAFASRIQVVPADTPSIPLLYSANTLVALLSSPTGGSFIPTVLSGDHLIANDGVEVSGAARVVEIVNLDNVNTISVGIYAELFG